MKLQGIRWGITFLILACCYRDEYVPLLTEKRKFQQCTLIKVMRVGTFNLGLLISFTVKTKSKPNKLSYIQGPLNSPRIFWFFWVLETLAVEDLQNCQIYLDLLSLLSFPLTPDWQLKWGILLQYLILMCFCCWSFYDLVYIYSFTYSDELSPSIFTS